MFTMSHLTGWRCSADDMQLKCSTKWPLPSWLLGAGEALRTSAIGNRVREGIRVKEIKIYSQRKENCQL